jgi:hypothetical protein
MTAGALFSWLVLLVPASVVLLGLSLVVVRLLAWEQPNYAGRRVASGYGIFFPAIGLAAAQLAVARGAWWAREAVLVGAAVVGCGAFGLLDDLYGRASPKGLLGHFRLLFQRRELTTGQIKAVGVVSVGIAIGALAAGRLGVAAIVSGALVALCANGINLVDTRPGRALVVALVAGAGIAVAAFVFCPLLPKPLVAMVPLALGCVVALPVDCREHGMLGDVGAYALGGGIGSALGLILPVWAQAIAVALLIGLMVLADRYSLSALLDRTRQPRQEEPGAGH